VPLAPFEFSHCIMSLFLQHLCQGNMGMLALQAGLTRAREAAATAEATHVMVVLAMKTSAQEATMAWDSTTVDIRDAEDQSTLSEREAREMGSRVEAENAAMLAYAHEDTEGLVQKVTLPEGELAKEARLERWSRRISAACLMR
jgi:hypothetical protein